MKAGKIPLPGSHALITGGARGIGLATARRLVREGCSVTIWDLQQEAIDEAIETLRNEAAKAAPAVAGPAGSESGAPTVHGAICDVTDRDAMRREVEAAEAACGPLEVLVNNAGYLAAGNFIDQPMREWDRTVEINVSAVMALTHIVAPRMYARRRGHIVNISSAAGTLGVAGLTVYSASKWAVWGFSESLRGEAVHHGVRVSSIHPSYIATGMFAGARLKGLGRFIVPLVRDHDVIAKAIVESAIKRGRTSPKRPRTVRLAILLRGILPDSWFQVILHRLGIAGSMSTWHGRGDSKE